MPAPDRETLERKLGFFNLYDQIDLDRVIAAVDPALVLYGAFADWAMGQLVGRTPGSLRDPASDSAAGPPISPTGSDPHEP